MAWFADLSPCTDFGEECASFLRSVGWLERGRPFTPGSVNSEVFVRLVEMVKDPWQPGIFTGVHCCDLCLYEGNSAGVKNVFVPGDGVVFVCPELIAVKPARAIKKLPPCRAPPWGCSRASETDTLV